MKLKTKREAYIAAVMEAVYSIDCAKLAASAKALEWRWNRQDGYIIPTEEDFFESRDELAKFLLNNNPREGTTAREWTGGWQYKICVYRYEVCVSVSWGPSSEAIYTYEEDAL